MIEHYFLAAYWGAREESSQQCARRAVQFLTCLRDCDPSFARWFTKGGSRKEALKHEVEVDTGTLQKLLSAGRNRTDVGHKVIESLGYSVGLWNGADDEGGLSLSIHCGSYAAIPVMIPNNCIINLPVYGIVAERQLQTSVLTRMMECAALSWNPDWGVVNSDEYLASIPALPGNPPRIGWMTYLSRDYGPVPTLSSTARIVPIGDAGSLIILTDERFTTSNPRHAAIAEEVTAILSQAGMLGPLRI